MTHSPEPERKALESARQARLDVVNRKRAKAKRISLMVQTVVAALIVAVLVWTWTGYGATKAVQAAVLIAAQLVVTHFVNKAIDRKYAKETGT